MGARAARAPAPAWHGEWTAGDVRVLGLWVALYLLCYLGGRRLLGARSPRRVWILTLANAVAASALGTASPMRGSPFFMPDGVEGAQTGGDTGRLPCPGGTAREWAARHLAEFRCPK